MREFVTLPNVITGGNLTAGFLALLVIQTNLLLAAALVVIAAVCDSVDGVAARRNPVRDLFGANLDSLADLVSFGVVPALALYVTTLHSWSIVGLAACLGFLLCGAWRLARFALIRNAQCFVGLPIPPAGLVVMLLAAVGSPPDLALPITGVLSMLMISELPFPTLASSVKRVTAVPRQAVHRRLPRR